MPEWEHDALAADLAGSLKAPDRMVWTDMQLGPHGSPRPDVYTIMKSYVRPCPTAYECKISKSDFRADVTVGKWSSYLEYAHAVVFACPAGLLTKAEMPEMCGLIVRHENVWRLAKKATINPRPIAEEAMLKLLIDGVNREGPRQRASSWKIERGKAEFSRRFGSTAARYVADAASVERTIEHAEYQRKTIIERAEVEAKQIRDDVRAEAPRLWAELLEALGLESTVSKWQVKSAIRKVSAEQDGTRELRALRQVLTFMSRTVENHREFMEVPNEPA